MPPQFLQPALSSLAPHRIVFYGLLSLGAVLAVMANAVKIHSNFYAVTVYLSKSGGAVMVLANFGLLLTLLFGRLLQQLFFGPLRAPEVERLYDRMWFFVTESLLAFTIFRDEFDVPFALMFGGLLFTKCFHWLLSDRIEWMDQRPYPGPPLLFHIRINALMALLWLSDFLMFTLAIENILSYGVGGVVLFASEYAILLASLLNSGAKYTISILEIRRASRRGGENAPPWEDKSMWIFYVELATDFLKLVTYLTFFILVLTFYGLPLNIVRDVYITGRSFILRFRDLIRYRTATRNMDQRYPNATEAEMNAMSDRTCIICREEMILPEAQPLVAGDQVPEGPQQPASASDGPNTTPKKLPCGHVFHFYCLRSWLERQQSCPTCRRTVLETNTQTLAPAPRGAAGPPPPQPDAAPQALNGFPFAGAPQQGQEPAAGNVNGFFQRLMGPPGAPLAAPDQFAPIPAAQWDLPPPQAPGPEFQPPLAPVEFQGFQAPGGGWQAWGVPEHDVLPDSEAPSQSAFTHPAPVLSPLPSEAEASRTATTLPEQSIPDEEAPVENSRTVGQEQNTRTLTNPREAAALAALKRSGKLPIEILPSGGTPRVQKEDSRSGSNSATADPVASSSGPPQPVPTPTTPPATAGPSRHNLPSLIPLYDPARYQPPSATYRLPRLARPTSDVQTAQGNNTSENRSPFFRHEGSSPPNVSGVFNPISHPHMFPQQQPQTFPLVAATNPGPIPSLASLPPTLTDEQLGRLDQLTRDAIDERLRVLEGVQSALWRCVEDLVRVRSVLPPSDTRTTASQPSRPVASNHTNGVSSSSNGVTGSSGESNSSMPSKPSPSAALERSSVDVSASETEGFSV